MEAVAEELRAGSQVPVTIEQIVNDTLVVTFTFRERSYTGILLDCNKKTGLFCQPDALPKPDECPPPRPVPSGEACSRLLQRPKDENTQPQSALPLGPLPTPVPLGQAPYPPYFEGAPFPPSIWVRHSYGQWVPQPPPRLIKRKKRRSREPGQTTVSTIRLRPRQVLCEKCKNSLNDEEDAKRGPAPRAEGDSPKEPKRRGSASSSDGKRPRKDRREEEKLPGREVVPHSPVIKISYSTPQGTGEVMKIPSRVHGSVKPFCPGGLRRSALEDAAREQRLLLDATRTALTVSIPKLKLTSGPDLPSPKIRLRPRGEAAEEESPAVYEAQLVGERRAGGPGPHSEDSGEKTPAELWSGSSGEEAERPGDLTLLINFRKRKADSSSLSVCSSDSLDDVKSCCSDSGAAREPGELAPGDDLSVSSSSRDEGKTVPPLTVRLHARSMSCCVTEEGHALAVEDVVWGKIPGFPWWPARVLSLSGGEEPWPEAKVAWFGSPTTSCLSVAKLCPFGDFFRSRFNRKKKGMYRRAIVEAAEAAGHLSAEITSLLSHGDT